MSRAFLLAFLVFSAAFSLSTAVFRVSASPTIVSLPGPAWISICDSAGNLKEPADAIFGLTDSVYACGENYLAGEAVILRVIPNTLVYVVANSVRNVAATANGTGYLGPVNLGVFGPGEYDVWVDRSYAKYPDGWWHFGDPVAGFGTCYKGFLVVLGCNVTFLTDPVCSGFGIVFNGVTYHNGSAGTFSYGTSETATATTSGGLNLPANAVRIEVTNGTESYFNTKLSDVPSGYGVMNATYFGWCIDVRTTMEQSPATHAVNLYLTSSPPGMLAGQRWDLVNYILNHKQGAALDVQQAIWYFIHMDGNYTPTRTIAWAIVNDALANGNGFVPGNGQKIAVICYPTATQPAVQISIIEVAGDCGAGYVFDHWEVSGNVAVSNTTTNPTCVTITCGGTLEAVFIFGTAGCNVTFLTDPAFSGFNITFQGATYPNGTSGTFVYGTSGPATANCPSNYRFDHWIVSGNVAVSSKTANPTCVTITCGGTLEAVCVDPPTCLPPTALFTVTMNGPRVSFDASSSYDSNGNITGYTWVFGDGNITSITNSTIEHAYRNVGNYTITLNVTDTNELWNTTSRTMTVTYTTDLNQDGTVNILDIAILARAYGCKPGDQNWNFTADLDKNGIINILDISMVARDYGKTV